MISLRIKPKGENMLKIVLILVAYVVLQAFKSDNHTAIEWYLKQARPDLKVVTIGSTEQDSVDDLSKENTGLGDFILVTPASMSKTYRLIRVYGYPYEP